MKAVVGAEILLGKINALLSLKQTYPAMWEAVDILRINFVLKTDRISHTKSCLIFCSTLPLQESLIY